MKKKTGWKLGNCFVIESFGQRNLAFLALIFSHCVLIFAFCLHLACNHFRNWMTNCDGFTSRLNVLMSFVRRPVVIDCFGRESEKEYKYYYWYLSIIALILGNAQKGTIV